MLISTTIRIPTSGGFGRVTRKRIESCGWKMSIISKQRSKGSHAYERNSVFLETSIKTCQPAHDLPCKWRLTAEAGKSPHENSAGFYQSKYRVSAVQMRASRVCAHQEILSQLCQS